MLNLRNKILIFTLLFSLNKAQAQIVLTKDSIIKLDIQVLVNDKIIRDSVYVVDIINQTKDEYNRITTADRFVIILDYNSVYEISVGYRKTNIKTIIAYTYAPKDQWYIITSIKLKNSRKKKRIVAGSLVYDASTKTFIKKKGK